MVITFDRTSFFCKVNFSRQIFLLYFGKGNFGGKNLLYKRVNLLCKEGYSISINWQKFDEKRHILHYGTFFTKKRPHSYNTGESPKKPHHYFWPFRKFGNRPLKTHRVQKVSKLSKLLKLFELSTVFSKNLGFLGRAFIPNIIAWK